MTTSALLVVDMQNAFCHPEGSVPRLGMPLCDAASTVAAVARALEAARRSDLPVIFTRQSYRPGYPDLGPSMETWREALTATDSLVADGWDVEIVGDLDRRPEDHVVDKTRFDAFLWTTLEPLLTGLGVDHLWVAGVLTTVCVESTVRAAFMRDYQVSLLTEACDDIDPSLHEAGIEVMTRWGLATPAKVDDITPDRGAYSEV